MKPSLRPRKSEDSAVWVAYWTLPTWRDISPRRVEVAHFPGAPIPYLCIRLADSKKVLRRTVMSADEFESFLLNLPKEDKPCAG